MPRERAFYVERISRCTTLILVRAMNKAEAKRLVEMGNGDEVDSTYQLKGFGKVTMDSPGDD